MRLFIGILCFLAMSEAFAGFGGSRGGFSSSRSSTSFSRSSSSFGGFRSGAASRPGPAPIFRSQTSRSIGQSSGVSTAPHTTIINNGHGGSGGGFWNGMFWGSMLNHGNNAPVVVTGAVQPGQTMVVEQTGHGFFYYVFWTLAWILIIFAVLALLSVLVGV